MKKTCDLLDIDSCKFSLFASAEDVLSCNSNRWVSYCRHMDRRKVHHVASARRRKSLTSRRKANRVQLSHLQGSYMIRVLQTSRIGNIESNLCGDKWRRMVNFKPVTYNCYILRISLTSTLDPIRGQRFQQLRHQPFCRYRQEFYRKKKKRFFSTVWKDSQTNSVYWLSGLCSSSKSYLEIAMAKTAKVASIYHGPNLRHRINCSLELALFDKKLMYDVFILTEEKFHIL